jgi:hypothetical protein
VELRRFFDRAIRASFADLAHRDDPRCRICRSLAALRAPTTFFRAARGRRLETVADMLTGDPGLWGRSGALFPGPSAVSVRRHIGDFTCS